MSSRGVEKGFLSWKKRRLPCVWLFLLAATGILAGSFLLFPPVPTVLAAILLLAVALVWDRFWLFSLAVVMAFFAVTVLHQFRPLEQELAGFLEGRSQVFTVEGRVHGYPRRVGEDRWFLEMRSSQWESGGVRANLPLRLAVFWLGAPPESQDRVRVRGTLRLIPPVRNPGQFDRRQWEKRRGVWLELRGSHAVDCRIVSPEGGNLILRGAAAARSFIEQKLDKGVVNQWPREAGVIRAMTLGDTTALSDSMREDFQRTGTMHLFAVSGLHIGMIAVILWFLLGMIPMPNALRILLLISLLFFYSAVTGLRPPSVRAAFMASVVLAGFLLARPAQPLNSLGAAGLLLLAWNPAQLFNPGFQLSFSVVAAILLVAQPMSERLARKAEPDPFLPRKLYGWAERLQWNMAHSVAGLAAVCVAAWLASSPLTAGYFHLFSISAPFVNLLAVPMAFVVLSLALSSVLFGIFLPWAGVLLNHTNILATGALLHWVGWMASLPFGFVPVGHSNFVRPPAEVVVFDFGRGQSVALSDGGDWLLVDTGRSVDVATVLRPFFKAGGIRRVSGIILTHGDASHIGGAELLAESWRSAFIGAGPLADRSPTMKRMRDRWDNDGRPVRIFRAGDRICLGRESYAEVLFPPAGWKGRVADDKALVLRLYLRGWSILIMGDAGQTTADWLLEQPVDLEADLVILGRHSSGLSLEASFLRATGCRWVISSSADYPETEKLEDDWVAMLDDLGIHLLRLDQTGGLQMTLQGDRLRIQSTLSHPGLPVEISRESGSLQ
jgi:competence protein ComEC